MEFIISCLVYVVLMAGALLSVVAKRLTVAGGITGFLVALLIFKGAGYAGIEMLALFFIAGSVATGWKSSKKQKTGISEPGSSRRTAGQVIANGGIAALSGGLAWSWPGHSAILQLMMAGSLASATADTLSSELGSVYGSRFYDILTFKKSKPGPDGVVSLEGTLIGVAGAGMIAAIYALNFGCSYFILLIIVAGAIGNLFDSILGATLERKNIIGNNAVNFLNTAIGAAVCFLLAML
jgi:uncharacterized protein (TIGR00297 family)